MTGEVPLWNQPTPCTYGIESHFLRYLLSGVDSTKEGSERFVEQVCQRLVDSATGRHHAGRIQNVLDNQSRR